MSRESILKLALNGIHVGTLTRKRSGAIAFVYAKTWLANSEQAIALSLSLPLQQAAFKGMTVINFLENLLPENDIVKQQVAARVGADGTDAFSLLEKIGRDCVGAIQFVPQNEDLELVQSESGKTLTENDLASLLKNLPVTPLGISANNAHDELRISIAGAQEKTALLWSEGDWKIPSRTTPTTHIFKPQIGPLANGLDMSRSVENEHYCMRLCSALGLPVANTQVHDVQDQRVLVIERFDRRRLTKGRILRLPQEDFCQALSVPVTKKYESDGGPGINQCLELLKQCDDAENARKFFLKTQIVFWLLAATDGHAKNFSLFLYPNNGLRTTPLYDIISLQPNLDQGQMRRNQLRLAMAVGNNRHKIVESILPRHFLQTAETNNLAYSFDDVCTEIISQADTAIEQTLAEVQGVVAEELSESICAGFKQRLKKLENQ